MATNCSNCEEILMKQLCQIPVSWRKQIVNAICSYVSGNVPDEQRETLTALSEFDVLGAPTVCITYKDEDGVSINRCFDFSYLLNQRLNEVDPKCIATQDEWYAMNDTAKIQAIVDKLCVACFPVVGAPTTTTSTTSTSTTTTLPPPPSTTTTTTQIPTMGTVYFGSSSDGTISSEDVSAGTSFNTNLATSFDIDFQTFNADASFLWFAIPAQYTKVKYEAINTPLNQGHIGDNGDLFGPPTQLTVNGVAMKVYVTAYATQFKDILKIS